MLTIIGMIESENWMWAHDYRKDEAIGIRFKSIGLKVIPKDEYWTYEEVDVEAALTEIREEREKKTRETKRAATKERLQAEKTEADKKKESVYVPPKKERQRISAENIAFVNKDTRTKLQKKADKILAEKSDLIFGRNIGRMVVVARLSGVSSKKLGKIMAYYPNQINNIYAITIARLISHGKIDPDDKSMHPNKLEKWYDRIVDLLCGEFTNRYEADFYRELLCESEVKRICGRCRSCRILDR